MRTANKATRATRIGTGTYRIGGHFQIQKFETRGLWHLIDMTARENDGDGYCQSYATKRDAVKGAIALGGMQEFDISRRIREAEENARGKTWEENHPEGIPKHPPIKN